MHVESVLVSKANKQSPVLITLFDVVLFPHLQQLKRLDYVLNSLWHIMPVYTNLTRTGMAMKLEQIELDRLQQRAIFYAERASAPSDTKGALERHSWPYLQVL